MTEPDGRRRAIYLGHHYSAESHREFRRLASLALRWEKIEPARQGAVPDDGSPRIADLCARFILWLGKHHRDKNRQPTGMTEHYVHAFVPLRRHYLDLPCGDLGIELLAAVGAEMESPKRVDEETPKLAASMIYWRINLIRNASRKGIEVFKLVPASPWEELVARTALGSGQTNARETREIPVIPTQLIYAALAHATRAKADMVRTDVRRLPRP